jgi:hypothetical protein
MPANRIPKENVQPCRVCGRNDELDMEVHDGYYTVCCHTCLMNRIGFVRGPYCQTEEDAIDAWNQRGKVY